MQIKGSFEVAGEVLARHERRCQSLRFSGTAYFTCLTTTGSLQEMRRSTYGDLRRTYNIIFPWISNSFTVARGKKGFDSASAFASHDKVLSSLPRSEKEESVFSNVSVIDPSKKEGL